MPHVHRTVFCAAGKLVWRMIYLGLTREPMARVRSTVPLSLNRLEKTPHKNDAVDYLLTRLRWREQSSILGAVWAGRSEKSYTVPAAKVTSTSQTKLDLYTKVAP